MSFELTEAPMPAETDHAAWAWRYAELEQRLADAKGVTSHGHSTRGILRPGLLNLRHNAANFCRDS